MNYTKGNWYWEYADQHHHNLRALDGKHDKHILFIAPDFLGEDSLTNEADAHLIAAAPDLYEALNTLYNTSICDMCYEDECGGDARCTFGKDGGPCKCHERITKAEGLAFKALAKAEGK